MPHRVANFFRTSTSSLESQVSSLAKKTAATGSRRRESPGSSEGASPSSERAAYASSIELDDDDAHSLRHAQRPKMGESRSSGAPSETPKEHGHHHRISFPSMSFGRSTPKEAHGSALLSLDWKLESPPAVLYGDAEHSSGALVSGQFFLNTKEESTEIEAFDATLSIHVTHKKPFANHCHECAQGVTELKRWQMAPNPLTLAKGASPPAYSARLP